MREADAATDWEVERSRKHDRVAHFNLERSIHDPVRKTSLTVRKRDGGGGAVERHGEMLRDAERQREEEPGALD